MHLLANENVPRLTVEALRAAKWGYGGGNDGRNIALYSPN